MARNRTPCETLKEPVWRRQPGETAIAYASFRTYRDLKSSERSVARVSREIGRNVTVLEDRARRWRWRQRAELYGLHLEDVAVAAQEDAVREMGQRHAQIAVEGLRKVLQRLSGDDAAGVAGIDASKLTASDCARLVEVLTKVERLSRGAETERVEQSGQPIRILLGFNATPNITGPEQGFGFVEQGGIGYVTPPELPPGSPN